MRSRVLVILLSALLVCALMLVKTQYQARHLFIELGRAQGEARELEVEWAQLQLDQSTLSKHARIQTNAIEELNMIPVTAERTQYLTLNSKKTEAPIKNDE